MVFCFVLFSNALMVDIKSVMILGFQCVYLRVVEWFSSKILIYTIERKLIFCKYLNLW